MKHRRLLALSAMMLALCSWSWTVDAQESSTGTQQEETDKFWQTLPPERQAQLREKWDNMTPQERADFAKQAKERQEKWQSMSPEKQDAIKERRQEKREDHRDACSDMTGDDAAACRKARDEKLRNMSPEEREQLRQRVERHKDQQQPSSN